MVGWKEFVGDFNFFPLGKERAGDSVTHLPVVATSSFIAA